MSNNYHPNDHVSRAHAGAAGTAPCPSPPPNPALVSDAARDLLGRAAHLHGLIDRIGNVTDRVFGCEPATTAAEQKNGEPYCDVARLQQAMQFLDLALERLEYQARRVEQF